MNKDKQALVEKVREKVFMADASLGKDYSEIAAQQIIQLVLDECRQELDNISEYVSMIPLHSEEPHIKHFVEQIEGNLQALISKLGGEV